MQRNVGNLDRALRAVSGLVLIGLALSGTIGLWGWIGLPLVATAAIGFCPAYPLLGLNTCATQRR